VFKDKVIKNQSLGKKILYAMLAVVSIMLLLAVLIFIGQKKLKWSPVVFIGISALVGIIFRF
jgi:uncharacterized membrane protein